jgi:hypothetical protein
LPPGDLLVDAHGDILQRARLDFQNPRQADAS